MKRELINNTKVIPYTSGAVVDRGGFLSAILAANVSAAGTLTVAVTHSDTATGTFVPVPDEFITLGENAVDVPVAAGDIANFDIDLVGCKQFVKITVTAGGSAAATYAVALGDPQVAPV